ncbi:MAG: glycosyltransferase family 2 protein [Verrucomicrobiota bacterium]
MPYFSVITPSFNQGRYLQATLQSVAEQKDGDYEHIVIDNCSTDETKEVLATWSQDPHLTVIVEPDQGQSEAVNKGFRLARGEIICWLNSDDAYSSETFRVLREIFKNPEIDVVFGDALQVFDDRKNMTQRAVAKFLNRYDLIRWWSSRVRLHQPAIFFRRSVVEAIGLLDNELHYAMDYEYWWRMSEHYHFHYIPEVLALQHRQLDSKTMKAWDRVLKEREKIFSPYYDLLKEKKSDLQQERTATLAQHYLLQSYSVVSSNRPEAWRYLKKAWQESPRHVLQWSSLGLLKSFCFSS